MGRREASAVTALAAVGLLVLSGCGILTASSFQDDSVVTEAVTSVRLDLDNGRVTVRGEEAATEVSVHRSVRHRGSRPEDPTYQVEDGVLVLGGCGRNCKVDYTIDLPAGLPVSGRTSNGAISLTEVGEVDVRTSNGRVEITLAMPQDVRAETSNGEITLTVPDGSYQVSTRTSNGDTDVSVPDDPAGEYRLELVTSNGDITVTTA